MQPLDAGGAPDGPDDLGTRTMQRVAFDECPDQLIEGFLARLHEAPVAHWRDAAHRAPCGLHQRRIAAARAAGVDRARDGAVAAAARRLEAMAQDVLHAAAQSDRTSAAMPDEPLVDDGSALSLDDVLHMHDVASTAVWALAMRDRLSPAEFEMLYWPFASDFPISELAAAAAIRPAP